MDNMKRMFTKKLKEQMPVHSMSLFANFGVPQNIICPKIMIFVTVCHRQN